MYYAPLGYGGRSQGAVVCTGTTNQKYNHAVSAAGQTHADAMAAANKMAANKCHLAPSVLGGLGDQSNAAYCWRKTNVGSGNTMRTFETQAQNLVKAGNVVEYSGYPIYRGPTSTVPAGFEIDYLAETKNGQYVASNRSYVKNDANGKKPNLGN